MEGYLEPKENYLKNMNHETYRKNIFRAMKVAEAGYKARLQSRRSNSTADDTRKQVTQAENETKKIETKTTPLEPFTALRLDLLKDKQRCAKHGTGCSSKLLYRWFRFDPATKKYQYSVEKDGPVKEDKMMDLSSATFTAQSKDTAPKETWEGEDAGKKYRLEMKFKQRNNNPIYFYTDDELLLKGFVGYCSYLTIGTKCSKEEMEKKLKRLLAIIHYTYLIKYYTVALKLVSDYKRRRGHEYLTYQNTFICMNLTKEHYNTTVRSWGRYWERRRLHERLRSGVHFNSMIRKIQGKRFEEEQEIIDHATKIKGHYLKHEEGLSVFEKQARAKRTSKEFPAEALYLVDDEVSNYIKGRKDVDTEGKAYTKWNFSGDSVIVRNAVVKSDKSKLAVYAPGSDTNMDPAAREVQVGEISNIVNNLNPLAVGDLTDTVIKNHYWICIHGRKINHGLSMADIGKDSRSSVSVDPSVKYLCQVPESYLGTKSLVELKIYKLVLSDNSTAIKYFDGDPLCYGILIKVGTRYFTRTSFREGQTTGKSVNCRFLTGFSLKVNPENANEMIEISVQAASAKKAGALPPDDYFSYKRWFNLGYCKIPLAAIMRFVEKPNTETIPLNNGVYGGRTDAEVNACLDISYEFKPKVHGNAPEVIYDGNPVIVGEYVSFKSAEPLKYPMFDLDYKRLGRERDLPPYDASKRGMPGCFLRIPMDEEEWRNSGLPGELKISPEQRELMKPIKYKIPYMFVLPSTEEEFKEKKLPGIYQELKKTKRPGELVDLLYSFEMKTLCKLLSIDDKDNCTLVVASDSGDYVKADKIIKHVSEIEGLSDEGISCFEAPTYLPQEVRAEKTNEFEWKLWLGFTKKEEKDDFMADFRQRIRDYLYKRRLDSRAGKTLVGRKIDPPISGELFVVVAEAKNLSLMPSSRISTVNPFVKLSFRKPTSLGELITDDDLLGFEDNYVKLCEESLSKVYCSSQATGLNPNWRTRECVRGWPLNCGRVSNIFKKNIIVDISVCSKLRPGSPDEEEIGHAEIPLKELLDTKHPAKYFWLLLKGYYQDKLPQIKLWTLFVPSVATAEDYHMQTPSGDVVEQFAQQLVIDAEKAVNLAAEGRMVPLGKYNPNYMRPEQYFAAQIYKQSSDPDEAVIRQSISDKVKQSPVFEYWEYKLIRAYRYFKQQAKTHIHDSIQISLWDNYLLQLILNETIAKAGPSTTTLGAGTAGNPKDGLRGALSSFDRILAWKTQSSWKYNELRALCKRGIPRDLRARLWSELFGISKSGEFEEKIRMFETYVDASLKNDSVVYEQMEDDIKSIRQLIEKSANNDTSLPESVLKVAKAYNAWCVEENKKNEANKIIKGYFKGLLNFIYKILQVFPESETFCSLLGFSKSLPLIFNVDSVMTGKVIWGQKFIMHAIKIILEKRYKALYNAVMSHGLPFEYYIADKISSLLSTVFLDETLMKIYDCIALETASEDSKRAMWIVVSSCLMIFTLNEEYLLIARSAEEALHIINSTGLNFLNSVDIVDRIYLQAHDLFTVYNPILSSLWAMITGDTSSAIGLETEWARRGKEAELKYANLKKMNMDVVALVKELEIEIMSEEEKKSSYKLPQLKPSWIVTCVSNFCNYYKNNIDRTTPREIMMLITDIKDSTLKVGDAATIIAEFKDNRSSQQVNATLNATGWVFTNRLISFRGVGVETVLSLYVLTNTGKRYKCEFDLNEFTRGFPFTIDLPLLPESGRDETNAKGPLAPQPFISFVLYLKKTDFDQQEGFDKVQKAMNQGSLIIIPERRLNTDMEWTRTMAEGKKEYEALVKNLGEDTTSLGPAAIGPDKIFQTTGSMMYIGDPLAPGEAVGEESAVRFVLGLRDTGISEEKIKKIYQVYSTHYKGRFPLKRFIISLIALSNLSCNKKLILFYSLLSAIGGCNNYQLALDDVIELVSILYEIHLCNIPPEEIPQMVEEIMEEGGNSRITAAYLCSVNQSSPYASAQYLFELLRKAESSRTQEFLDVTDAIKDSVKKYYELWGKKLIMSTGKNSLFGTLERALGKEAAGRASKIPGPHLLIVCYRHKGSQYYREYRYSTSGEFIRPDFGAEEPRLAANSHNLNFTGSRISLSQGEFISRFNLLPLLPDLMRMHLTLTGVEIEKRACSLDVDIMMGEKKIAEVNFSPRVAIEEAKGLRESVRITPGQPVSGHYIEQNKILKIQRPAIHTQDLLLEVRGETMLAIEGTLGMMLAENKPLPIAFDLSKNPNITWQFFMGSNPIDEYTRLGEIKSDVRRFTLRAIEAQPQSKEKKVSESFYMLHVHADHTMEWLECKSCIKTGELYEVQPKRFKGGILEGIVFVP